MEVGKLESIEENHRWINWIDGGKVLMAFVTRKTMNKILKITTKRTFKRGVPIEEVDNTEANRLLGRAAVRNWKGLTSDHEDYPFTEENLDELMEKHPEFSDFVNEKCIEIGNFVGEATEKALGKSESTPSGGSETA